MRSSLAPTSVGERAGVRGRFNRQTPSLLSAIPAKRRNPGKP